MNHNHNRSQGPTGRGRGRRANQRTNTNGTQNREAQNSQAHNITVESQPEQNHSAIFPPIIPPQMYPQFFQFMPMAAGNLQNTNWNMLQPVLNPFMAPLMGHSDQILTNIQNMTNMLMIHMVPNMQAPDFIQPQESSRRPNHEIYYKTRSTPKEPFVIQEETEPFIRIIMLKPNQDALRPFYDCSRFGVLNSDKNTTNEDIMIGRLGQHDESGNVKIIPNDIILSASDKSISRLHCKIITKNGLFQNYQLTKSFIQFLQILKIKSLQVNGSILDLIYRFQRENRVFYIQDLGSMQGTFIKISSNQQTQLSAGKIFLIGAETIFYIKNLGNERKDQDQLTFFKFLNYYQMKQQSLQLHFQSQQETREFERYQQEIPNQNTILPEGEIKDFINRPFLELEFKSENQSFRKTHLFLTDLSLMEIEGQTDTQTFKIGRQQDCEIIVNINTISRKQCKILYQNKEWYVMDGDERESANGTWMNIQKHGQERNDSEPYELQNNTEIKISETVFKVEFHNLEFKEKMLTQDQAEQINKEIIN